MSTSDHDTQRAVLQSLIYPETGISAVRDLYVRLDGAAGLDGNQGKIQFVNGGIAGFDTYFNLFNLAKWQKHCGLTDLRLVLEGEGRFELEVFENHLAASVGPEHDGISSSTVFSEVFTLQAGAALEIDLSDAVRDIRGAALDFQLRALGPGVLDNASWTTAQQPVRTPDLVLSITTFRREEAVQQTVERFRKFIATSPLQNRLHLVVVDNGRSAGLTPCPHVTPVGNENLGGAGGFTRGLIEAKSRGASHCLFMDDDATLHMETLERTWTFLAYATDPTTCVPGALTHGRQKWQVWENGALFDRRCRRLFGDLDLRDPVEVMKMECDTALSPTPPNFYGGWWFFAFPIDHVDHLPFPFFVRGDDISFSLANNFVPVRLPGVVTFQDEDFSNKESAQTLYLDLRNHLAHHLSIPHMRIGAWRTARIAAWFFARSMSACHYETLAALNLAIEDVLEGPEFFSRNIDMSKRRADIRALMNVEGWKPASGPLPAVSPRPKPRRKFLPWLMARTFNGHMIPFFRFLGTHRVVRSSERGDLDLVWGASRITYVDHRSHTAYTVTHSKAKALQQGWRMLKNGIRFLSRYRQLTRTWESGYAEMTTEAFWIDKLKLPANNETVRDPAPARKPD